MGALRIRMAFSGIVYYTCSEEPPTYIRAYIVTKTTLGSFIYI